MSHWATKLPNLEPYLSNPRIAAARDLLRPPRLDPRVEQVLCLFLLYYAAQYVLRGWRHVRARSVVGTVREIYGYLHGLAIQLLLALPSSRRQLAVELAKTRAELVEKLAPGTYPGVDISPARELPAVGRDRRWLEHEWDGLKKLERGDVAEGRVSGAVYHGGDNLNQIINEAMARFIVTNPLHPDVFPGVRKMESEVVSMVLKLFHGDAGAGTTTSGGTESILMSVKTHRDWARAAKGITRPEMIIPSSAHAAFWKGAEYFGVKLHVVPVNPVTRKADVAAMRRAVNANTIMLVGSAPNFPDGIIDPIPALGQVAKRYNIGLHVDCCLGSFILAFVERAGLGAGLEPFDFRVEGVTAISCDTHKYAFCPKGSSVIMYRSPQLRRFQYYVMTDWAGGVYASPSMAGSRPGSVIAGAWAVLNHIGIDGYTESCRTIVSAARHFATTLPARYPQLCILGDPRLSVVAFTAAANNALNVYALGDALSKMGWHLNALSQPAGLHMAFTRLSAKSVDKLLDDIGAALKTLTSDPPTDGDMVALYGLGQTSVGPHVVGELAATFLDVLYE
ncbi:Dihydrosphingosine phosphate lyase [Cryptotrichosporon argae]